MEDTGDGEGEEFKGFLYSPSNEGSDEVLIVDFDNMEHEVASSGLKKLNDAYGGKLEIVSGTLEIKHRNEKRVPAHVPNPTKDPLVIRKNTDDHEKPKTKPRERVLIILPLQGRTSLGARKKADELQDAILKYLHVKVMVRAVESPRKIVVNRAAPPEPEEVPTVAVPAVAAEAEAPMPEVIVEAHEAEAVVPELLPLKWKSLRQLRVAVAANGNSSNGQMDLFSSTALNTTDASHPGLVLAHKSDHSTELEEFSREPDLGTSDVEPPRDDSSNVLEFQAPALQSESSSPEAA
jgi:hypothetical protein